jgi:hypothetical protein
MFDIPSTSVYTLSMGDEGMREMVNVRCGWCERDMGKKEGPEGKTSDGICVVCLCGQMDLSPSKWLLLVSIELDNLDADMSKPKDFSYNMAEEELRRLAGERNRPTVDEADPTIPESRRPLFGFGMQFADGLN